MSFLFSSIFSSYSLAADAEFNVRCEQGARQVASVWGTPAMDAHLADNFTGNTEQFSVSEADAARGLQLDVVSVENVEKVADHRCKAEVSVRFVHPQPDHTVIEILPPVSGSWTLKLPKPASAPSEPARFNAGEQGALEGIAMLRVHWDLPTGSRAAFLQDDAVQADLLTPSEKNNDSVRFPLQPASGWVVRMGNQETMTEKDGSFVLKATKQDVQEGEIINPATRVVFHKFALDDLVAVGAGEPSPIIVELQSHGGCGMDDDDPQHCGQ